MVNIAVIVLNENNLKPLGINLIFSGIYKIMINFWAGKS